VCKKRAPPFLLFFSLHQFFTNKRYQATGGHEEKNMIHSRTNEQETSSVDAQKSRKRPLWMPKKRAGNVLCGCSKEQEMSLADATKDPVIIHEYTREQSAKNFFTHEAREKNGSTSFSSRREEKGRAVGPGSTHAASQ
jgi:hypothetical protein